MKNKLLLMTALLSVSALSFAADKEVKEEIKVMIEKNDDGNMTKKVIMNGKELSADEIKELEASGKLNVLHLDDELHGKHGKKMKKMIVIDSDEDGTDGKHMKIIKKHLGSGDQKNVWISKHAEGDQDVEVEISKDGKKTIEKIIINGKELSADEIKDMKASGDLKVIHLDEKGEHGKHVKVIKKYMGDGEHKNVWISKDGKHEKHKEVKIIKDEDGNETITVNGKELSVDEAKEFKKHSKMKTLHMDTSSKGQHKVIVVESESDSALHEFRIMKDHDGKDGKRVIKKRFVMSDGSDDPDRGRLGFMANVEDDGWHVISVMDESGAKEAGIKEGDVIVKVGDRDLTSKGDETDSKSMKLHTHKVGDQVKVKVNRDGKMMDVTVEARALKSNKSLEQEFEWTSEFEGDFDFGDIESKMIFINKEGDFEFDEDDIHITFPESLKDMNVFISDGKSTSKLLGKRHKFSSMSEDLAEYFYTKGGVLVLSVDSNNVFGLKDGDVVKKVNGNKVDSPKAIIKELLKAEEQKKITLKVVRHKKNKTLKAKL
jgi:hypothetical protein